MLTNIARLMALLAAGMSLLLCACPGTPGTSKGPTGPRWRKRFNYPKHPHSGKRYSTPVKYA